MTKTISFFFLILLSFHFNEILLHYSTNICNDKLPRSLPLQAGEALSDGYPSIDQSVTANGNG